MKLYVTEFARMASHVIGDGQAQIATLPAIAEQSVDFTAGAAASETFNTATNYIRIHADAPCSVLVGDAPTATTGKLRLAKDQTEYFEVGTGQKISAVSNP
jgi:hypothetical protein